MDYINHILSSLISAIRGLRTEQIALISIFVSFIIYTLNKRTELKMKKHEAKKEHYRKFIEIMEKIFSKNYDNNKEIKMTEELRKEFFDLGSSLLFYGSKRIYRQYIFYRELSNNKLYQLSKYYDPEAGLYIMADIFRTIRKEIGLNTFDNVSSVEALAFLVNDFANNPFSKINSYKAKHKIRMLKIEIFFINELKFVILKKMYYMFIAPIFSVTRLLIKYLILIPLGKIVILFAPDIQERLDSTLQKLEEIKIEKK